MISTLSEVKCSLTLYVDDGVLCVVGGHQDVMVLLDIWRRFFCVFLSISQN